MNDLEPMLVTRVWLGRGGVGRKWLRLPYEHAAIFDCFAAYYRRDTWNHIRQVLATRTAAVDQFACCV